jgi:pimeloyl-ACP methyl ester carboxylesterase
MSHFIPDASRGSGGHRHSEDVPIPWLAEEAGFVRRTLVAGGYRLSYVTGGRGEAVLLIHGIGSDASCWRATLPTLAAHYSVYAVDLLGCGDSEKPDVAYSVELLARTLGAFTEALGLERLHVVGHSLGGGVALQFHAFYPERVARLALVASGGLGRELHWILRINALPGAHSVLRVISDPRSRMPSFSKVMERRRMRALQATYDAEMPTVLHRLRERDARSAFVAMARAVCDLHGQTISALPHLPSIDVPTLLIWGGRDTILPVTHGFGAVQLLKYGHLHILPASRHRPQVEQPEAFNAMLLSFLRAVTWPPEEILSLAGEGPWRAKQRSLRQRTRRVALALAAMSLAAGAGWRYVPRSWRLGVPRRRRGETRPAA